MVRLILILDIIHELGIFMMVSLGGTNPSEAKMAKIWILILNVLD